MNIPKEHHRIILGKAGSRLQKLELETATKITIPRSDDKSCEITIVGTQEGVHKARHEIQLISDEQVSKKVENKSLCYICSIRKIVPQVRCRSSADASTLRLRGPIVGPLDANIPLQNHTCYLCIDFLAAGESQLRTLVEHCQLRTFTYLTPRCMSPCLGANWPSPSYSFRATQSFLC